jgi:hypothetical protein
MSIFVLVFVFLFVELMAVTTMQTAMMMVSAVAVIALLRSKIQGK